MGISDAISAGMDVQRVYEMASERTIEEVFELLKAQDGVTAIGVPELKKGLFGKNVKFPKVSRVTPVLTVKGTKVTIKKVTDSSSTSVKVGGIPVSGSRLKMNDVASGGEYFSTLCDAIQAVLEGK